MVFNKKQLTPTKRVCLRLKELRQKKDVSLEVLSKKTKLSKKYLKALEECRFDDLPPATIYKKNFVKCYVKALGINPEPFLKQYIEEEVVEDKKDEPLKKEIKNSPLLYLPAVFKFTAIISIIFLAVGYLGLQVKQILEPPELAIYSPKDGFITENNFITIQGQTEKEALITINGQEIINNEKGEFKENINLNPGINNIVISAQKKHGKKTTETRHVILKENPQLSFKK